MDSVVRPEDFRVPVGGPEGVVASEQCFEVVAAGRSDVYHWYLSALLRFEFATKGARSAAYVVEEIHALEFLREMGC